MKKSLLFLSAIALLLAGCTKEQSEKTANYDGDTFTFEVGLESPLTKAVVDNDGNAAKVNHWVMEVLDSDGARYNYQEKDGTEGDKKQTFEVRLVKGQVYTVMFWADKKGIYDVDSLKSVKLKKVGDDYPSNDDALDAFSAVVSDFQTIVATNKSVTLKRPFGQMNIIFTDLKNLYETMGNESEYLKFAPTDLVVTAKLPTEFNVMTQECGTASSLSLKAATNYLKNYSAHREKETIFMDYIFASANNKDILDLAFSFVSKGTTISHNLNAVPFQRNFRTNIIGDFMSSIATWNVTVDPIWLEPGSVHDVVNNVKSLNEFLASSQVAGGSDVDMEILMPTDSDTEKVTFTSNNDGQNIKLAFTGNLASGKTLSFVNSGTGNGPAKVELSAPAGTNIECNLPGTHFIINGTSYGTISGSFSANSLIISAGVTVNVLSIAEGGLEIHGTVQSISIPDVHGDIYVRDCEGLSQSVYDALAPYIDIDNGYAGVKKGEDNWDIVKGAAPFVAKIGDKNFYSLDAAFAVATDGQTIELLANCSIYATRDIDKTVILDLCNKTLTANVSDAYVFEVADGKSFTIKNGVVADGSNGASKGFAKASSGAVTINVTEVDFGVFNTSGTSNIMFPLTGGTKLVLTSNTLTTNNNVVRSNGSNNALTVTGGVYTDTKRNDGTHTFDLLEYDTSSALFDGVTISSPDAAERQSCIETDAEKGSSSNIVLKDCTISATYGNTVYCNSDVTIINCDIQTGNGADNSFHALSVESENTLNVYGGTIKSNSTNTSSAAIKIWNSGGIVNIYDTYEGESVPVKIEGYNMFYIDSNNKGEAAHTAEIHFNGDNITTKGQWSQQHSAKAYVKGGYHEATVWSSSNAGTFILSGGTFTIDPRTSNCFTIASGYTVAAQGTGPETWKVVEKTATPVSNETELKNAIANSTAGDEIKLTASFTISSALIVDKNVVINLNGKTITAGTSLTAFEESLRPVSIKANGVVIKNGTITGPSVTPNYPMINVHNTCTFENLVATTPGVAVRTRDNATLTITGENGSYSSTHPYYSNADRIDDRCYQSAVYITTGTVNIEGGEFKGGSYAVSISTSGGTANISGGTFYAGGKQTEDRSGNQTFSLFNDGNTATTKGYIKISGSPVIKGSIRGRVNNCPGQYGYIDIRGGVFDSGCLLWNYDSDKISYDTAKYTVTDNGDVPVGTSKFVGKQWILSAK